MPWAGPHKHDNLHFPSAAFPEYIFRPVKNAIVKEMRKECPPEN
jgi:hypothetical protein